MQVLPISTAGESHEVQCVAVPIQVLQLGSQSIQLLVVKIGHNIKITLALS